MKTGFSGKRAGWAAFILAALLMLPVIPGAPGAARAEDTSAHYYTAKYRWQFTKENLDAVCRDYNIRNGKYWCVKENVLQDFRGIDRKGATRGGDTSGNNKNAEPGYYGCVWPGTVANEDNYNAWWDYGTDCDGFCKFIGYLLTGSLDYTADSSRWNTYESGDGRNAIDAAGGLKTGDMIFSSGHVAVVYTVSSTDVTVMECWGSWNNRLSVGSGFNGRDWQKPLSVLKNGLIIKVCRAKANDGETPPDETGEEPGPEPEPEPGPEPEPDPDPEPDPEPEPSVAVSVKSGSTWAGNAAKNNGFPVGKLNRGKNFGLRGVVEASEKITAVTGSVLSLDRQGADALAPVTVYPNRASLDIRWSAVNDKLAFEKLGDGAYAYVISVTTESGYRAKVLASLFTVGSGALPETLPVSAELLGDTAFVDRGSGPEEIAVADLAGAREEEQPEEEPDNTPEEEPRDEPEEEPDYGPERLPGDVNEDGAVDARDVVRLMNYLAGEDGAAVSTANSDVNGDGRVDGLDLARLVRYCAGESGVTLQ